MQLALTCVLTFVPSAGVDSEEVGNVRSMTCHVVRRLLEFVLSQLDSRPSSIIPFTRALSNRGAHSSGIPTTTLTLVTQDTVRILKRSHI